MQYLISLDWGKIVRFLVSGSVAALVNLGVLYLLTDWLGLWYMFSATFSFLAALVSGFILQKIWAFRSTVGQHTKRQFLIYCLWALVNFSLNLFLLYVLVDGLGVYYLLAQILVSALLAIASFLVYSRLVFVLV